MLPIVKLLKVLGPEYTGMSKQIAKLEAIIYKKSVDGVRLRQLIFISADAIAKKRQSQSCPFGSLKKFTECV